MAARGRLQHGLRRCLAVVNVVSRQCFHCVGVRLPLRNRTTRYTRRHPVCLHQHHHRSDKRPRIMCWAVFVVSFVCLFVIEVTSKTQFSLSVGSIVYTAPECILLDFIVPSNRLRDPVLSAGVMHVFANTGGSKHGRNGSGGLGGTIGSALDSRSEGRGFDSH